MGRSNSPAAVSGLPRRYSEIRSSNSLRACVGMTSVCECVPIVAVRDSAVRRWRWGKSAREYRVHRAVGQWNRLCRTGRRDHLGKAAGQFGAHRGIGFDGDNFRADGKQPLGEFAGACAKIENDRCIGANGLQRPANALGGIVGSMLGVRRGMCAE